MEPIAVRHIPAAQRRIFCGLRRTSASNNEQQRAAARCTLFSLSAINSCTCYWRGPLRLWNAACNK